MSGTATSLAEINAIRWFHKIDLGGGIVTPGIDHTAEKIQAVHLPRRLDNWSVLDIGAWDGAMSFECEKRGAARVVASDWYCWQDGNNRGFQLARKLLNSRVEDLEIRVEDINPERAGTFDLVLFLGVLYHAQDPMAYLRVVRSVCRRMAIIETVVDALDYDRPAMVYYPGDSLNNDPTNFWGPNPRAVLAMLRDVGFQTAEQVSTWCGNRAVFHAYV
jgi:tRNA (mo5U34)-methyltransferase